jgi:hypothetical protein
LGTKDQFLLSAQVIATDSGSKKRQLVVITAPAEKFVGSKYSK